jgi:hypothetical protein
MAVTKIEYTPVPSVEPYIRSEAFQNFIVGPVGSTKTTASIMKILYEASRVAPARDGIRRSRYAVVRNTRQQLLDSTIKDFLKWYVDGQMGTFLKTDMTFQLQMGNIHADILFRGLDDANDVRRLLSLQLTGAFCDEVREINPDVFNALTGRLGRYPDGMLVPHRPEWGLDHKGNPVQGCVDDSGRSMKRVWGSTNPPDMDTFWHTTLDTPAPGVGVWIQPSGLSVEADWIHLLPTDYYEDLMIGKTPDWIDVYVHAKWGKSLAGQPVFKAFNRDLHVAKHDLRPLKSNNHTIIVGMDFGLNPSAVIGQVDMFGRLIIFAALTSNGMGLTRFLQSILRPFLSEHFPGLPVVVVGDPAGVTRAQTDERSCYDILKKEGFKALPARSNSPVARIAAVDTYLMRQVDGKPGFLIDPKHGHPLVKALAGGYRYKLKKTGELEDSPEKNEHSHIADACQYLCLHADGGLRGTLMGGARREVKAVRHAGWT